MKHIARHGQTVSFGCSFQPYSMIVAMVDIAASQKSENQAQQPEIQSVNPSEYKVPRADRTFQNEGGLRSIEYINGTP